MQLDCQKALGKVTDTYY